MTAWTQRPEDEHRLLSSLLVCFLRYDALPADLLTGPLAELGLPVPLTIALPPPEDRAFADVWSALGGELKPSLDIVVSAPTDTGRRLPGGAARPAPPEVSHGWRRRRLAAARAGPQRRASPAGRARPTRAGDATQGTQEGPMTTGTDAAAPGAPARTTSRRGSAWPWTHRRADDPAPDDPFRGLYVNDETVDRLLGPALRSRCRGLGAGAAAMVRTTTGRPAASARARRRAHALSTSSCW